MTTYLVTIFQNINTKIFKMKKFYFIIIALILFSNKIYCHQKNDTYNDPTNIDVENYFYSPKSPVEMFYIVTKEATDTITVLYDAVLTNSDIQTKGLIVMYTNADGQKRIERMPDFIYYGSDRYIDNEHKRISTWIKKAKIRNLFNQLVQIARYGYPIN